MQQLTLWEDERPIFHNHICVVWLSGHRETYCTAGSYRPADRPGDWEWEAGFVGRAMRPEECTICNKNDRS